MCDDTKESPCNPDKDAAVKIATNDNEDEAETEISRRHHKQSKPHYRDDDDPRDSYKDYDEPSESYYKQGNNYHHSNGYKNSCSKPRKARGVTTSYFYDYSNLDAKNNYASGIIHHVLIKGELGCCWTTTLWTAGRMHHLRV
jgi:hypothetical protein